MRVWLLLAPLLLAGCAQPNPPSAAPAALPPSLLVDRSANGTLLLYVHAKQANVRYEHLNLSVDNVTAVARVDSYALEEVLPVRSAHVAVEVVDEEAVYRWAARFALNETAEPPTVRVEPFEDGEYAAARESGLPYEKLLPRQAREEA